MIANLFFFAVLIGLTVLLGWLTTRAWRAQRALVKWPGVVVGGLLTGVMALVTFLAGKGLAFVYIPPAPAPDLQVEGTPEQIARGEYLAGIACVSCHGADGSGEFPLSGGFDFSSEIPLPIGKIVAANITPGGVLADRTDGELFRALRLGYGKGARAGFMTFMPFRQLSDEDTIAIIAYLRSQQPVDTPSDGGDDVNLLGITMLFGAGLQPLPETIEGVIVAPPEGPTAEHGKYMATVGDCRGCHGPDMTGSPATAFAPEYPNPRLYVNTITQQQFIEMMRTGVRPNGVALADAMPWENAAAMTDSDLIALYTYLTTPP